VDRPNLLVKIPATQEGQPAITGALAEGVSVNVTLIFSVERYRAVMGAYLDGLEQPAANGHKLAGIASVASFFVSRVDTEIDKGLDAIGTDEATALTGKAGVANSRLAYSAFQEVFASPRWEALEAKGAKAQRPLWASTGVKNPECSDTLYVTELAVADTVNTMPEKTMMAFADHGELVAGGDAVTGTAEATQEVFDALAAVGVDLPDVFRVLEDEGVDKFDKSWAELLESVRGQLEIAQPGDPLDAIACTTPTPRRVTGRRWRFPDRPFVVAARPQPAGSCTLRRRGQVRPRPLVGYRPPAGRTSRAADAGAGASARDPVPDGGGGEHHRTDRLGVGRARYGRGRGSDPRRADRLQPVG